MSSASPEPEPDPEALAATIAANLAEMNERIATKCAAVGRDRPVLVAVSKTKPLEYITSALAAGQHDFGENYLQEMVEKATALAGNTDVRWHFIGTLQSNKVKMLAGCPNLAMVHTLPSQKTAAKLSAASEELRPGNPLAVLVQVNSPWA
jgi:pyridoxal phosphate enzyme (YggS family)